MCVCVHVSVCVCMHTHLCVCARACLHVYGDGDTIRIAVEQEMWAMYYDQIFMIIICCQIFHDRYACGT